MVVASGPGRWLGGIVGAGVPAVVAGASSWLDLPMTGIAGFGIPIGAAVGIVMAPRVIAAESAWMPAVLPFILFFAFLFGMPVALPVGLVSAALLRRIVRSGWLSRARSARRCGWS